MHSIVDVTTHTINAYVKASELLYLSKAFADYLKDGIPDRITSRSLLMHLQMFGEKTILVYSHIDTIDYPEYTSMDTYAVALYNSMVPKMLSAHTMLNMFVHEYMNEYPGRVTINKLLRYLDTRCDKAVSEIIVSLDKYRALFSCN